MTEKIKSVCPYCGVGCGIVMEVSGNRVIKVTGDKEHPANYGRLCTKGNSCAEALVESGRMEFAYQRPARGQAPVQADVKETIKETARRLRAILDEHGPDAISFYVSGQMSLEAQYLVNKLSKGFIRTNHIESNSRLCMASAGSGYKLSLGADGPPGSYEDMDRTNLFFVIGANMADCHPILFLRVMDRVKAGAKLIVVDPRRNATADKADLYMQIKPGTDLALLNGILYLLVHNGHTDQDFISRFTAGWESMPDFLDDYTPDKVAAITGIPEADIRLAAQWIGESPEWMSCWTMGLNQSTHGTWHTNAICNLHLATGKICRPGSGPFSLTGQPNAMGGREMGYMGPGLPGQRSVLVEAERHFMEDLWNIPRGTIRTEVGTGTISMFQSMQTGDIKACWIICTNPVATVANRSNVIAALQAAELVITQDAFLNNETNAYADIMLPGALWAEAEGVMINSERNVTLMRKAVDPPGEALPDWKIIAEVACEMGFSDAFTYASSADVYREIQQAWNPKTGYDIRGASYERLREAPVQWPSAPQSDQTRNPIRYLNDGISQKLRENEDGSLPSLSFATDSGKAVFWARPYAPPAELPDSEFPFVLNTGRLQHQWHTMTKTGKIAKLNKLNPGPFIEIHPEDAAALGVRESDRVHIQSRRGHAILPAVITDRVMPGSCFAPFHWNDAFGEHLAINAVTSDAIDPVSLQPEFKYSAVSLTVVADQTTSHPDSPRGREFSRDAADTMNHLQKEEKYMAKVDTLADLLGIPASPEMTLDGHEKIYLAGFIASLRADEAIAPSGVPVLPHTAPVEPSKKLWLDGLLAGMFSRTQLPETNLLPLMSPYAEASATATMPQQTGETDSAKPKLTLLWASQTGNAEDVANECSRKFRAAGLDTRLVCMNEYAIADLASEQNAVFISSTFGAGDPPDNGEAFWHALKSDNAPRLHGLRYAVLGLGDSSYDEFCGFARNLDARLEQLGASRLTDRVDCDTDFEQQIAPWIGQIEIKVKEAPLHEGALKTYDRNHPLHTRIVSNRLLSGEGSEKETRHYAFDISDTGFHYEAGDALGVWPVNCPSLVEEILQATGLDSTTLVNIKDREIPLSEALLKHLEIARITPGFLQFVQERSGDETLKRLIQDDDKEPLRQWLWGRQIADVLQQFPIRLNTEELLSILKPLQPRFYSISSSYLADPDTVHITVSTVRYECNEARRHGVCSAYLADRAEQGGEVRIFVQKSTHFRPPANPEAPMIMVGPGTGIGPFRGFLQERQAQEATGRNWLIFGEQRAAADFYYEDELESMKRSGYLHRLDTAFSRDQEEKIYVQDRMLEHGAELWKWLEEGAHFYVCGDASRMAKEVDATLHNIIQKHGGMSRDEAESYVKDMLRSKRYAKDVY
nr:sulfite reductase subunit alpha [Paenibacillus sp. JJ-223]